MSVEEYFKRLAESELGKTLTGDEAQHRIGDKEFQFPRSVEMFELRPEVCMCIHCRTIRAIRHFKIPPLTMQHAEVVRDIVRKLRELL